MTDSELARELAGYVLGRVTKHLGLEGAEIDMDNDVHYIRDLISNLRSDFGVLSPEQQTKYLEDASCR